MEKEIDKRQRQTKIGTGRVKSTTIHEGNRKSSGNILSRIFNDISIIITRCYR